MSSFNYITIPYLPTDRHSPHDVLGSLEGVLQEALESEGKRIVPSYFRRGSPAYPQRLEFVVGAIKATKDEPKAGALVATLECIDGIKFIYYDKIGVIPPYQNNGVMGNMLRWAEEAATLRGINIAALRTTIEESHEKYRHKSDIKTKIDKYYVHGFGFIDKATGQEKFPGAREQFEKIARYIASFPPTTVPIDHAV